MAFTFLVVILIGFGPTYYFGRPPGAPQLQALVHVHAVIATAWCLLFLTQATLIATHRIRVHRKVGVAGAILAGALVVSGYLVAVNAARLGHGPPGRDQVRFLAIPLGGLVFFSLFFGLGIWNRTDRDAHKRFMVLATIVLLSAAFGRLVPRYGLPAMPTLTTGSAVLVLMAWGWDLWASGRIHRVLLWGGIIAVLSLPLRYAIARTQGWEVLAGRLISGGN